MQEVRVAPRPLETLAAVLPPARAARLNETAARARSRFGDRIVWHVSSTASGGGVAELLQTLLAYGTAPRSTPAGWCSMPTRTSSRSPSAFTTCSTESLGTGGSW